MPWFALDDGFDTHPKVRRAGNAAIGVFVRLGAYAARHLTEGRLDGSLVRDYGTPATVKKLVTVGLLHPAGHDCPRCEQPAEDGYVIHDFLDYNRSRKQIESSREAGRKRQQKGRARQADQRNSRDSDAKLDANSRENAPSFDAESRENEGLFWGSAAGQDDASRRYTLQGDTVVPAQPSPAPSPPTEEKTASYAREPDARIGDRPRIPDNARPLVEAITAAGMVVGWELSTSDWFVIEALIKRCGTDALTATATASWHTARTRPRSARYFLPAWRALPDVPANTPAQPQQRHLPAVAGGAVLPFPTALTGTDRRIADHAALIAQMEAEDQNR